MIICKVTLQSSSIIITLGGRLPVIAMMDFFWRATCLRRRRAAKISLAKVNGSEVEDHELDSSSGATNAIFAGMKSL